jgi:putative transposase
MKEEHKLIRQQTANNTAVKRLSQVCKVFEFKLDKSHISKEKRSYLNSLFLESKWLYNDILSSGKSFKYDTKTHIVSALDKDGNKVEKELKHLSSQMRQEIRKRLGTSIKSLSTKKKQNKKVGKLKFKRVVNSVPLIQYGSTYRISNNYLTLQGYKKAFKIMGLKQLSKLVEEDLDIQNIFDKKNTLIDITNANLIRKNNEYYIKITLFLDKKPKVSTNNSIGLDFGIKDNITDNFGKKYNPLFPEPKKLKKAYRKLNKAKKGSKNRYKAKIKLNKLYNHNTNKKKDYKNKFVSALVNNYDYICIQDEQIHNWAKSKMKGWGRRIQHSIMGGIISELKTHSETLVVDRFFASTKLCPNCGIFNKLDLKDRIYSCKCGYSKDRDTHSANNIRIEGLKKIDKGLINTMPVEKLEAFLKPQGFKEHISKKQETGSPCL